jgi:hypothetical protein
MLPTESKVVDSSWFPLIMTDAALFHALLCTSALFGFHDMTVQRKHMLESIRLINNRLPGVGATSDATITAILFMAKAEVSYPSKESVKSSRLMMGSQYFQGNHGAWGVHMDGVKRIIELRGGMGMLSILIQQKIYRSVMLCTIVPMHPLIDLENCSTDLLGCLETGTIPHFPTITPLEPLFPPYSCDLPPAVVSLAETYTLDPDFRALLSEISTQTTSLPATHDTPSLQYRLLSLYFARQYQHPLPSSIILTKTSCSQLQQPQSEIIQELLFIGALLYLSLPHMRALPPIRPVDYGYLLSRLNFFASPLFNRHTLLQHPDFLLWLFFLGEVFSSISVSLSTCARERSPFRLQLRAVSAMLEIASWEEMKIALSTMWAIEPRHEKPYRCLWEEAVFDHEICYDM